MAESKSYGLHPIFERSIAVLACSSKGFWGRIGENVDPDFLEDDACKLVFSGCNSVAADNNRPPDMPGVVLQRIQRWHEEGRVTQDALDAAEEIIFEALQTKGVFNEDAIIAELIPIVRRRMEREALEKGLDSYGKKKQLSSVAMLLEKASRIGNVDTTPGVVLKTGAIDHVTALKKMTRFGTGIPELDSKLHGGMPRGCFGVVIGPAKAGKSMFLCHIASHAIVHGLRVAYASLEISDAHVMSRIIANITDLSSESLIADLTASEARARLENLEQKGLLPYSVAKFFPPDVTTVQDIKDWVDREQEASGVKFDVICTDYIQLIGASQSGKKLPRHEAQKLVAQDHRFWAIEQNAWVWTAAQPQRGKDSKGSKKTMLGLDDVADSMYITRTCDLGISINPQEEGMSYHVAGFRHGEGGQDAGPFETAFAYGRMSHVDRPAWPYWQPNVVDDL